MGELLSPGTLQRTIDPSFKRVVDVGLSFVLLLLTAPMAILIAAAIRIESRGPILYECQRMGCGGRRFSMLKFRKMIDGATGPSLTTASDERFTRVGKFLSMSKLDELPQLWNVLRGDMSIVGPRPESPEFVALAPTDYERILSVRPGITGLSQLAFARESAVLDADDRVADYVRRIFPQKRRLDLAYVTRRTIQLDLTICAWTIVAVLLRSEVAVDRATTRLTLRRRPAPKPAVQQETLAVQEETS